MADDFGQTIQGLHKEGDVIAALEQHIGVFGKSVTGTYKFISMDAAGQIELAHDILTNPVFTRMTDTVENLNIYLDGAAPDTGLGVMGKGTDGFMHFLKTDATGEVIVNIGATNSTYVYATANLVKDTITTVVTESPGVTTRYIGVVVTGLGLCEWEIQFGTTLSEATIFAVDTTPSHPTEVFNFPAPLEVTSTQTIRARGTNRENRASPTSDFTGRATLIKEV